MSKIKKDKHGLYLLAGGYCFRPIFDNAYKHLLKQTFLFSENDSVTAKHIGGTSLCKLKKDAHNETWYSHGCYIENGKKIHSENLFNSNYIVRIKYNINQEQE